MPISAISDAEHYSLPNIAVKQGFNDDLVIEGRLQVTSVLEVDFRDKNTLAQVVELLVFGANIWLAYDLTPKTSREVSFILAFDLLEFGLKFNSAIQETFDSRETLDLIHDFGPVKIDPTYNSKLNLDFDNFIETAPWNFSDKKLEKPREIIASQAKLLAFWPNLLLETIVVWKDWDNAESYRDTGNDNYTLASGGQDTINKWKLRLGYNDAIVFQKKNVGNLVADINSMNVPGQGVAPVSKPLVQLIQVTQTVIQQIIVGYGYARADTISLDAHLYALDGDRTIGETKVEVNEFQVGAGFIWAY